MSIETYGNKSVDITTNPMAPGDSNVVTGPT
jgi:hypothetical protein